jgi:ornithine cyclodeaminase
MEETGDLKIPEQEGVLTQDMLHAELGDIVAGRKQGNYCLNMNIT